MSGITEPAISPTEPAGLRSARRSSRVESPPAVSTENPAPQRDNAPESLTPSRVGGVASRPARRHGSGAAEGGLDGRTPGAEGRVRAGRLLRIQAALSDRDVAILESLTRHRFLTTSHLQQLHFQDHATHGAASRICRRVLARLTELRIIEPLARRVGGVRAGSASYVWRLGPVGDQLRRLAAGDGVLARRKEPSERWLDHCLAVADVHLTLIHAARARKLDLLTVETEPDCWRDYLTGAGAYVTVKPDLFVITAPLSGDGPGQFQDHWFVEVDRATESLPTVLRKCGQYATYQRSGREQHARGVFPYVLWVVPTAARAGKLRAALRTARSINNGLHKVVLLAELVLLVLAAGDTEGPA